MTSEHVTPDAALFRGLRRTWERIDPVPAGLVDRMVAAVAAESIAEDYVLLTLVESDAVAPVRGVAETLTLQFSDGTTSMLVHITSAEAGGRRLDGWVDGIATTAIAEHDEGEAVTAVDGGRFSFDALPAGTVRLRLLLTDVHDPELRTPRFDI
ncbi:hypothetical protein [Microbacterium sp.]|uniref:hypothetical protein n=1 Tax=Microbacterium sp. TaxID=51671 RepID=UPI003A856449